ncbi:glycoside hydrolase family 2 protein [Granulicella mallensis]|uniref:Beta-mannosidase n=1 Tax=Granulicella mallensis TaxID=940614 RepID=A0A7W7ZTF4_9BACT|nr:glycoside hydrolase family 2 protein [Granulicella mallensis]MBB5065835.1 beta-mannosidase [Granulicella mallensis]
MVSRGRVLLCLLTCALVAPSSWAATEARPRVRVPLDSQWTVRQLPDDGLAASRDSTPPRADGGWFPATVPGDVHLDLLHNGKIPDPFYRDNESKLQWIEKVGWEYQTSIRATPSVLSREHIELVFEGLDTACTIFLNGQRVAAPDNMFREWRIDVKPLLRAGSNELQIVFPAPMKAAEAVAEKDPWHSRTHTDPKGYIRKAVYEFGWDWGPRFGTSGVFRPAYLELWDDARVDDIFVEQENIAAGSAHLDVHTDILASSQIKALVSISYGTGKTELHADRAVTLTPGNNRISIPIEITHPQLWYPSGYGAQPIYHFHVSVKENGRELDAKEAKTGLRSVVLRRDLDKWGRSFEFVVNGIPVFAKGADVIPFDSFPSRVTSANYRRILQSAKDANMNMVRLWGGGYYETEEFYDQCDELGLMIWHDLMFGNNWQPGTYAFKQDIEQEAEYQMTRLRNHPSIVLWSGNNETELLRDWNGNGQLPAPVHERIWEDYLTEFSGILARTVARVDPQTPYWPSSPSADYEELSDTYQSGDNHDWTVWHGNADFSEYEKRPWRFVSEYGFQSFPELKSVESFTLPEDRTSIFTPVMLIHQKNNDGNKIIHDYMTRYYGEPKDFPSFLYASQVLQAEGIKVGAESFRRKRPETMGSIFWQLNDCWPVASWASIDYYGRWKALQYYARRFYAPVLVSPHVEDGTLAIYVVSDRTKSESANLHLRIMHFDGSVVKEIKQTVDVAPLASTVYLKVPLADLKEQDGKSVDLTKVFASVELSAEGETPSSNLVYFAPTKQIKLPQPDINTVLTKDGTGYDLELKSAVLARSVFISFDHLDAQLSDNYVDLLPGQAVRLHIKSDAGLNQIKSEMKIISLANAFAPQAEGHVVRSGR